METESWMGLVSSSGLRVRPVPRAIRLICVVSVILDVLMSLSREEPDHTEHLSQLSSYEKPESAQAVVAPP